MMSMTTPLLPDELLSREVVLKVTPPDHWEMRFLQGI